MKILEMNEEKEVCWIGVTMGIVSGVQTPGPFDVPHLVLHICHKSRSLVAASFRMLYTRQKPPSSHPLSRVRVNYRTSIL